MSASDQSTTTQATATAPSSDNCNNTVSQQPHQKKRRRTSDDLVETQNVQFDLALNRMRTRGLSRKIQEEEDGKIPEEENASTKYLTRNRHYEIYESPETLTRRKPTNVPKIKQETAEIMAPKPKKQHNASRTLITASSSDESPSPSSSTSTSNSLFSSSSASPVSAYSPLEESSKPPSPTNENLETTPDVLSHLTSLLTAIHNPDTTAPDAPIDPSLLASLHQAMEHIQQLCDGHENPTEGNRVMDVCESILDDWVMGLVEACDMTDIEGYEGETSGGRAVVESVA